MNGSLDKVKGIALCNFRSFGEEFQAIHPLERVNLLVGQNNCGKSNVLRFLAKYFGNGFSSQGQLDQPIGRAGSQVKLAVAVPADEASLATILAEAQERQMSGQTYLGGDPLNFLVRLCGISAFHPNELRRADDEIWLQFEPGSPDAEGLSDWQIDRELIRNVLWEFRSESDVQSLRPIANFLTPIESRGSNAETYMTRILSALNPFSAAFPKVVSVGAFRQIRDSDNSGLAAEDSPWQFDGLNLKRRLQALERPTFDNLQDKKKFRQITEFVRSILDDRHARVQVPSDASTLHVTTDGLEFPLENIGTGLHEVVMLAAAATVESNSLICLEEPEIHLHPVLQRKLIEYLASETSNRYVVATHSAHILDLPRVSVSHVRLNNHTSTLRHAKAPNELSRICRDLGYRASDLLQANCVIWVEGPSDRVYLQHWLSLHDSGLVEGEHFSIMFYGGRLIRHLSVEDEDFEDFISLRRLNRNSVLMADSDRDRRRAPLKPSVARLRDEFDKSDDEGYIWITKGRTVENYVEPSIISDAFNRVHPKTKRIGGNGHYDNILASELAGSPDKVSIARLACQEIGRPQLNVQDLHQQLSRLSIFIRRINGITKDGRRGQNPREP